MRLNSLNRDFNLASFLLLNIGVLFLIWPIPHTVALREILLFVSLFVIYLLIRKNTLCLEKLTTPAILYALFLGWVFSVAVFSKEASWALREFKSQWIIGTLPLILGTGIAVLVNRKILKSKTICLLLFWSLTVHIVCIGIDGIFIFLKAITAGKAFSGLTALTIKVGGLTIGPIDASVLSSLLMAVIFVELFYRIIHKKEYLPVNKNILYFSLGAALLSSLVCGMRNIFEISIMFILSNIIIMFSHKIVLSKKISFVLCSLFLCSLILLFVHNADGRWKALPETINIVWNIKEDKVLLNAFLPSAPSPILSNKKPVNMSNYQRFAKFKMGLAFARENPHGIGFGRNAFGHSLKHKNSIETMIGSNSDSSIMDMMIGTGFVGLFLWLSTSLSLLCLAFKYFIKYENYYALWLIITIICFGSRTIIDSILRDHLLHQFMFLVGFLSVVMTGEVNNPQPESQSESLISIVGRMALSEQRTPESVRESQKEIV